MALLATVLESYEGLVTGRIGYPMLTKEDYDQIDAEEMELIDIKWCLASVLRRAEKFKLITGRDDFWKKDISRGNVPIEKQEELRIHSGIMTIIGKLYINKLLNNHHHQILNKLKMERRKLFMV
ncbi:hypothetical protein HanRHA438_Chr08g0364351 [Helianthus annuus]|nr:hypothetical protein HanIR_Chr08g0379891 [Helianthus annuus]KAJ0554535.1 hypothetical protein HanHA89_Chr08g0308981 [Helianthus annuus]KAJ0899093.1 hypothetical protein HanRHA438_Chr08g0364351 [Helianthus annuus]